MTGVAHAVERFLRRFGGEITQRPGEPAEELVVKTDPDDVARQYAMSLLSEARDELTRADLKASILLAASGVGASSILAGMISSTWSPLLLRTPWNLIWILGACLGLAGIGALAWAIYPRTSRGRDDEGQLFYFRQAAGVRSVEELTAELRKSSLDAFRRSADQLWRVSQVVSSKYRGVRVGIWLLIVGSIMMLVGGVANELGN